MMRQVRANSGYVVLCLWLLVALLWLVSGCSGGAGSLPIPVVHLLQAPATPTPAVIHPANIRFIPAPDGARIRDIELLPDQQKLAINYQPADLDEAWAWRIAVMNYDGSEFTELPLTPDPTCRSSGFYTPRVLDDGRLGYYRECFAREGRHSFAEARTLWAYDFATGAAEQLVPYYFPPMTHWFDWSPDRPLGIADNGNRLFHNLYWILPHQLEKLELPLARAREPSWSPDGRTIAFEGSRSDDSRDSVDRLELPSEIYLLSADDGALRLLVDGFVTARKPHWSPDGKWITANVDFAPLSVHNNALWLIEVATGRHYTLLEGGEYGYGSALWLPDGRTLVKTAVYTCDVPFPGFICKPDGLYIFELPDLDQYATAPESGK